MILLLKKIEFLEAKKLLLLFFLMLDFSDLLLILSSLIVYECDFFKNSILKANELF